jgi:hypothetical protein
MALTKISTAMISQSAAAVDLNVDAGTFYVDTTNNRVGVGGKTDPDTPLHVVGTATATLFAGSGASLTSIPNSALVNSSITINSTAVSLGGSLTLTTANIAENTNLYYTDARADARIAAADTDDLSEGSSNLYYTDARVDARVSGGSLGNITTTGYIRGPATFTIDPAAHGDNTGTVVIAGNLQVDGTQTVINSTTLTVDDKNITLASGSANAAAASGAGFTVDIGTGTNPAITYDGTNDKWDFNKPLNVTGSVLAGTVAQVFTSSDRGYFVAGTSDSSNQHLYLGSYHGSTLKQLTFSGSNNALYPQTTASIDLGLSSHKFKNLYLSGTISSGAITSSGTGSFTGGGNTLSIAKGSGSPALAFLGTATDPQTSALIEGIVGGGLKFYTSTGTLSSPSWSPKITLAANGYTTFAGGISATGSANSGSAAHLPAFLASGNYGGGIATRDTKESGWYQQTSGADWHFYHNRTIASDTPASKIVLSFNSSGNATFAGTINTAAYGSVLATTQFDQNVMKSSVANQQGAFVRMAVSSATNPTYAFEDDTDTGMYRSSSNALAFTTGGVQRLLITSSGNVAIAGNIEGTGSNAAMKAPYIQATNAAIATYGGTTPTFHSPASGTAAFSMNGAERMRIKSNGKVGIGTDDPSTNLTVVQSGVMPTSGFQATQWVGAFVNTGATTSIARVGIYAGNASDALLNFGDSDDADIGGLSYSNAENSLAIRTNNAEHMRIKSDGKVGIGTDDPSSRLHVHSTADTQIRISADNSMALHQDAAWNSNMYFGAYHDGSNIVYGQTGRGAFRMVNLHDGDSSPQHIAFYGANAGTAGNTVSWNGVGLAMDEDGNVGIGTTAPGYKLDVSGTGRIGNTLSVGDGPGSGPIPANTLIARMGESSTTGGPNSGNSYFPVVVGGGTHLAGRAFGIGFDPEGYGNRNKIAILAEGDNQGYSHGKLHFAINSAIDGQNVQIADSKMTILKTGNVGIGTPSPADILTIAKANSQLRLVDTDDSKFVQFSYSGGKLITRNNSTNTTVNQITLTEDGKVGIGTITPGWQFVVQGAGSGSGLQDGHVMIRSTTAANPSGLMFINSGNTASYNDLGSIQGIVDSGNAKGALRFITRNSDGNNTGVAERMRISSAGDMIYGGATGVHEKTFSGIIAGSGTVSHDIVHTSDAGVGTILHIQATMTHHPSYDCILDTWVSRRTGTFVSTEQFRRNTGTSGSWAVSYVSSTVTRITKVAGTYVGGGPYWIKATWKNYD